MTDCKKLLQSCCSKEKIQLSGLSIRECVSVIVNHKTNFMVFFDKLRTLSILKSYSIDFVFKNSKHFYIFILLRIDETDKKRPNSSHGRMVTANEMPGDARPVLPVSNSAVKKQPKNRYKFKISDCKNVKVDFRKIKS